MTRLLKIIFCLAVISGCSTKRTTAETEIYQNQPIRVDAGRVLAGDGKVYNHEWSLDYESNYNFGTSLYNATFIAPANSLQDLGRPFEKFRHDMYFEIDYNPYNLKIGTQNTFDSGQSEIYERLFLIKFRIRF